MKRSELVFIPAPGIGHLVSTLEFAKRLIYRHDRLSVTVLCMKLPFAPDADAYTKSLVDSQSRVTLIDLPQVDSPPPELLKSPEHYIYVCIGSLIPHVRNVLTDIVSSRSNSDSIQVSGVVLDFFCMPLMDVVNELGLPPYMFLTSNLGFLGLMLYLPTRHEQISSEFKDSSPDVILSGFVNPVPASVLPSPVFDKDGGYITFIKLAQRFRETKGIIVNSFAELESHALNTLSDGQTPPIYMVGPVLDLKGQAHPSLDRVQRNKIMNWLDEQSPSSVVFLCFGSMGRFGISQLIEIAAGLECSGHRFLWSIRVPQLQSLEEILPQGFLERTGGKGMICDGWVPQAEVLAHSAIGGFISHCGWNSILESLWHEVPIATWPLYAEQQMNAFRMVREFGLAVELRLDCRDGRGLVMADEIETAVRRLMENESDLRKKVKEMSAMARKAVSEGGSSFTAIENFINDQRCFQFTDPEIEERIPFLIEGKANLLCAWETIGTSVSLQVWLESKAILYILAQARKWPSTRIDKDILLIHPSVATKTLIIIISDTTRAKDWQNKSPKTLGRSNIHQEAEMKWSELVFIPAPGIGHLVSTLEYAKRLINRHDRLSVTVLCMKLPFAPDADAYTKSLVGSQSRVTLIDLPQVDSPPPELLKSPVHYFYVYVKSLIPYVRNVLIDVLSSCSNSDLIQVSGVVLDFFCMPLMDVANELGLPSYMFFTSNLGLLGLMLYLPTRHEQISFELKDSSPDVILSGFVNPVPASVLPSPVFDKDGGYITYIKLAQRFRETKGIIVNSFTEMESHALNSLTDGQTPPIYMVGPVLDLKGQAHPSLDQVQHGRIMKWLDEQPPSSVVFLCFGSMGRFGISQLREIAAGLECSGHRFLWSISMPQSKSLEEILPQGFLERIGGKGMICDGWAPQVEILAHSSMGGFVSHCGWNSILESLWYGVPIATWPIYAEQQMNAFRMVREFGLAVELRLDYRDGRGLVMADEIETAVRRLMEGDSELRKKVKEMSEMARKAVAEGGSSFTAVGKFINDIVGCK
ncbi:hypothetical protein TIFTF001_000266 [Ficus carica]|uniref:Uncharacterized protein n=1 Tax=Ficus carica TaxID=3494 RepID=A0AA87Z9F5_FICCA|nr:hypothetical protein TIFTF001_000266 [Ficus carica]